MSFWHSVSFKAPNKGTSYSILIILIIWKKTLSRRCVNCEKECRKRNHLNGIYTPHHRKEEGSSFFQCHLKFDVLHPPNICLRFGSVLIYDVVVQRFLKIKLDQDPPKICVQICSLFFAKETPNMGLKPKSPSSLQRFVGCECNTRCYVVGSLSNAQTG